MLKSLADDVELNDPPNLTDPDGQPLLGMKCHFIEVNTRYLSDYVGFALWYYRKGRFLLKEWQPVLGQPRNDA
jgi:hypothetical protein